MSQTTKAPNKYTCGQIDEVIGDVKDSMDILKNLEAKLEKLREANSDLRTWGEDSQTIIEDLEYQLQKADEKIYELEETIKLFSIS